MALSGFAFGAADIGSGPTRANSLTDEAAGCSQRPNGCGD